MSDLTAADVREALLRLAGDAAICSVIARRVVIPSDLAMEILAAAEACARELATCAAEARAEGER